MDIYDKDIEYLTLHPGLIYEAWTLGGFAGPGRSLFKYVSPDGKPGYRLTCGCLTMVNALDAYAFGIDGVDTELSLDIARDMRIPSKPELITVADLPVFAEWQRKIDKRYNRTV